MHFHTTRFLVPALAAMMLSATSAWASQIDVTPSNPNGWLFSNMDNSGTNASGGFEVGPGSPPLGTGSAQFIVGDANSSEILFHALAPTSLSTFTTLGYSTYVTTSTPGSGSAPTLQFDLYNGAAVYQGRLVFDPGLLGTVVDNSWQSWNASTQVAWYFSRQALVTADSGNCSIGGNYCSFTDAAAFLDSQGIVAVSNLFKAGSGQASFDGNVDAYTANDVTVNFDPNATTAVPEPFTISLFGGGLAAGAFMRRRRKPKA